MHGACKSGCDWQEIVIPPKCFWVGTFYLRWMERSTAGFHRKLVATSHLHLSLYEYEKEGTMHVLTVVPFRSRALLIAWTAGLFWHQVLPSAHFSQKPFMILWLKTRTSLWLLLLLFYYPRYCLVVNSSYLPVVDIFRTEGRSVWGETRPHSLCDFDFWCTTLTSFLWSSALSFGCCAASVVAICVFCFMRHVDILCGRFLVCFCDVFVT